MTWKNLFDKGKLWDFLSLNSKKTYMYIIKAEFYKSKKHLRELCENVLLGCKLILEINYKPTKLT